MAFEYERLAEDQLTELKMVRDRLNNGEIDYSHAQDAYRRNQEFMRVITAQLKAVQLGKVTLPPHLKKFIGTLEHRPSYDFNKSNN